jgi:hypothetical protein
VSDRSAPAWLAVAGLTAAALVLVPLVRDDDDDAAGFDGFIQSGTCAEPSDDLVVDLESDDDANDIDPYVAIGDDGEPATLGYYGSPMVPGFGVGLLHTGEPFSLVVTDPDADDEAVACGDLLKPDDDDFVEVGVAVVQLLPAGSGDVQGFAVLERARLERETDIPPTRARVILSTEGISEPAEVVDGYEVLVQGGTCEEPSDDLVLDAKSDDDHDVSPFLAEADGAAEPVTVAYYGAAPVPGFGLASAYTDQDFSVVLTDPGSNDPVACGDVLEPEDQDHTETGLALVQLLPTGDDGPQGFALVDRRKMERELDITPTLVRVLLFAPPVEIA